MVSPPKSEAELLARARALAGLTLGQLAERLGETAPPVDRRGRPAESTFVCTIDLGDVGDVEWVDSWVKRKLSRVLWVPVQGERAIPPAARQLGEPLLWSPDTEEEAA